MSALVLPTPSSKYTARCTCCGLEIITPRRTRLRRRSCPRCLYGRLQPPDSELLQIAERLGRRTTRARHADQRKVNAAQTTAFTCQIDMPV